MGLLPTYVKLAVRLCSVLPLRLTNQNRGHKRVMLELTFILINDIMCVLIHIGFHNVVLCYYKIHEIINTKLPTLK